MTPFEKKIEFALKLIRAAANKAAEQGQPVEVCYSGGKDSDVILELAKMAEVNFRAIYKNTTIDPPGTIAHVKQMGVEVMQPKMTFRQVIEKKGLPNRWRRFCCGILKEYKILDYAIIGVRREESVKRASRYKEPEICRLYSKGVYCCHTFPILDWTAKDIEDFIELRGIKCHELYYDSSGSFHPERRLGCLCCPLQGRLKRILSFKENPRMVRFYIKAAETFLASHPDSKIGKIFNGNACDWFVSQVFCDGERDFRNRFGGNLFYPKVDTKTFLQEQFLITL